MYGKRFLDDLNDKLYKTYKPKSVRSPSFNEEESKTLLNCLKDEKIVFSLETNAKALRSKELAWRRITNRYNSSGQMKRPMKCLQIKFYNMKKRLKKENKNASLFEYLFGENSTMEDVNSEKSNTVLLDMVKHFKDKDSKENKFEGINYEEVEVLEDEEMNVSKSVNDTNNEEMINEDDNGEGNDEDGYYRPKWPRSSNFNTEECKVLLECLKREKVVFSPETNGEAKRLKDLAWRRITNHYNSSGLMKRSTKCLQNKFFNIKKRMKRENKDTSLFDFLFGENSNSKSDDDTLKNNTDDSEVKTVWLNDMQEIHDQFHEENLIESNDHPNNCLEKILLETNIDMLNGPSEKKGKYIEENKELLLSKKRLVKYKLENARLENTRIKEQIRFENIERALRLRAARLKLIEIEERLGKDHPALEYTSEEKIAQEYMNSES